MRSGRNLLLNLDLNTEDVDQLLHDRSGAAPIKPRFVLPENVKKPDAYNRFRELTEKNQFRALLLDRLEQAFQFQENHSNYIEDIKRLAAILGEQGAAIFGEMIDKNSFIKLIDMYNEKFKLDGSKSWLHSYLNIGNHPDFILNREFNSAFMHPLLIALIAFNAGGPIRIVDARGKDAEPMDVQAQDNMLHIDNTPFRKEYKVILTWERDKPSGPRGQNFVFIPGSHKAVRDCFIDKHDMAWSTENGSIFTDKNSIETIFAIQAQIDQYAEPTVVEVTHPTMPLTTIFEAGALVHHRYRTEEKDVPRSCVIVAMHRATDNPGQFIQDEHLANIPQNQTLLKLMMGSDTENTVERFIDAVVAQAESIKLKLDELRDHHIGTTLIAMEAHRLAGPALEKWMRTVTASPTVETIKTAKKIFKLSDELTIDKLHAIISMDKHGPLDLILYEDGREEVRKWARNRVREMPAERLRSRLEIFDNLGLYHSVTVESLQEPAQLQAITTDLVKHIDALSTHQIIHLDKHEKILPKNALLSVRQLIQDLGEAIVRCANRQEYLSTSFFLFWASDELSRLLVGPEKEPEAKLLEVTKILFSNYIATNILIAKQLENQLLHDLPKVSSKGLFNKHEVRDQVSHYKPQSLTRYT